MNRGPHDLSSHILVCHETACGQPLHFGKNHKASDVKVNVGPCKLTTTVLFVEEAVVVLMQEKWLEEQKADIVSLEGQLTNSQARVSELEGRLADAQTSAIDQVNPQRTLLPGLQGDL